MKWKWVHMLLGIVAGALGMLLVTQQGFFGGHKFRVNDGDWSKLEQALRILGDNYVDTIRHGKLTESALGAVLGELDPHSVYLPPVELKEAQQDLSGNFEGIGIQFNVPADTAIVLEVIAGGPSEKAGLMSGDRLLQVDGRTIAGVRFPQDSMVRLMRGPSGTRVDLLVRRGKEEIPFAIVRDKIPMHSVEAAFVVRDTVGYIRLSKFSRTTFAEFRQAVVRLLGDGMTRLVLDLRDNTGGYLDQALLLCNDFLHAGDTMVYLEGLHRKREVFTADGRGLMRGINLAVLIGENTASASEIFAGAMQDNDRGLVVGRRSFGKGLVQEPFFFSDGSGVRLTVSRYYTPSGRCIQKPYGGNNYQSDIYRRYTGGEVFSKDSVKLDVTDIHHTRAGRTVYGGGGIMPDVYVPMDTTRATAFFLACGRKALPMRFASEMNDRYASRLCAVSTFGEMDALLATMDLPSAFRKYALRKEKLQVSEADWKKTLPYLVPQLEALVARYSKLGGDAFYRYYLPVDEMFGQAASAELTPEMSVFHGRK